MAIEYNALKKLYEAKASGVADEYQETIDDKVVLDVKFQTGGTATNAKNGIFIEDLLILADVKLNEFQAEFPCRENALAITAIEEAILWLTARKAERENRNVYGKEEV